MCGGGNLSSYKLQHEGALSVEDLVSIIQKTPRRDPLPEAVFKALHHLDSRALALLLKVRESLSLSNSPKYFIPATDACS